MVKFTSHLLSELGIDLRGYIESMRMCPAHLLEKIQEKAILKAYIDWY